MAMLVFGPEDQAKIAEAFDKRFADEWGGCGRPESEPQGDCCDGDCWCSRYTEALAKLAVYAIAGQSK